MKSKARLLAAVLCLALLWPLGGAAAPAPAVRTAPGGVVCLTVDDGYGRTEIKKDLDVLKANGVRCTFFVIGSRLAAYPDLWRRAVAEGHEICYHSMNHTPLSRMSDNAIRKDLDQWNSTARRVLGAKYSIPKLARLPGGDGDASKRILAVFAGRGYRVIRWSVDTYTGAIRPHRSIAGYVERSTKAGSIILTHFNAKDAAALPQYIGWLRKHFRLSRVSDALAPQPKPTAAAKPTAKPTPQPKIKPFVRPTGRPAAAATGRPAEKPGAR